MSILGSSSSGNTGGPFFKEFKKQASFFLKEKIKTARLALTDVTPAELLTEEATDGNPWAPDTRTLKIISKAAFEVDDYWRILQILHNRLVRFERKNWRASYQALIVLEHLLTHGPESVAEEFQSDKDVIREMGTFQHIDERGFNWGLNVRKKSEKMLKLLDKGPLLKEERDRARKLSRGIEGFGSFSHRTSSVQGFLRESPLETFGRCHSQYNEHGDQEDWFSSPNIENSSKTRPERSLDIHNENFNFMSSKKIENLEYFRDNQMVQNVDTLTSFKENVAPKKEYIAGDFAKWNSTGESNPLVGDQKEDYRHSNLIEEDHPFEDAAQLTTISLLSTTDQIVQSH